MRESNLVDRSASGITGQAPHREGGPGRPPGRTPFPHRDDRVRAAAPAFPAGTRADSGPQRATRTVGVVGTGNSARALSCYLSRQGHQVRMLTRDPVRASALKRQGYLKATGRMEGEFAISDVLAEAAPFAQGCSTIFVATVTNAYPEVARKLAPHLTRDHELVLFSSKLAGCVEVSRILHEAGAGHVPVVETDALFACRVQEDGSVWVRGHKSWTLYSAPRASCTREAAHVIERYFPGLEPATNVIQRGLTDFGALCHPVVMLANLNAVEREQPFAFYFEGLSSRTVKLLERMEEEFRAIAHAYRTTLIRSVDLLDRYYGCEKDSILNAMRTVPNYRHSVAPTTLDHRYFTEDVPNSLVPLQGLARKAGLATPTLDSVIHVASIVSGEDFADSGRTLARLGWAHMTHEEIVAWVHS